MVSAQSLIEDDVRCERLRRHVFFGVLVLLGVLLACSWAFCREVNTGHLWGAAAMRNMREGMRRELERIGSEGSPDVKGILDIWGRELVAEYNGRRWEIRSAGADGIFRNADDVVVSE